MIEFELSGQKYRAGKLSAFEQLHLSRKIAPLLPKMLPVFAQIASRRGAANGDEPSTEDHQPPPDLDALADAFSPLAQALAEMPDADCEYVFASCLRVVSRLQAQAWASIWNTSAKSLMFDDIDLPVMTQMVVKVIADNLGPFMQGLLAQAQASSPAAVS